MIVLDNADEVLLFLAPGPSGPFWLLPGGADEPGESFEQAARRELFEETRIELANIGPWVWHGSNIWDFDEKTFRSDHRFFFVRLDYRPDVDTSGAEDHEADHVAEHRWWSQGEMALSSDIFSPLRIANLLEPLIAGNIPAVPVDANPLTSD